AFWSSPSRTHLSSLPHPSIYCRSLQTFSNNALKGESMKLGSRRIISGVAGSLLLCLIAVSAIGQAARGGQAGQGARGAQPARAAQATAAAPAQKPPMAEEVFKKVDVLKGIPMDEFMDTMGMFSAALSLNCIDCHVPESVSSWDKFAEETPLKV